MPEDSYERRLVEQILEMPGSAHPSVRDEYLSFVAERVDGGPPPIKRFEDSEPDVTAIVSWCAGHPNGLGLLVDGITRIEQSSAAVDRLRALRSVRGQVEVLAPAERRRVEDLMSGLDSSTVATVVSRIAPQWGPRLQPATRNTHELIRLLEDSIASADEPHPLYAFLAYLAQQLDNPEVHALAGTVSVRTGTNQEIQLRQPPPPARQYFVIQLLEDGRDASRFLLTVWLHSEDGHWEPRHTAEVAQTIPEIKDEIDGQLARLGEDPTVEIGELTVEFIVPRSLLGADLDQWIVEAPGVASPIGVHYPVGVRDERRMRNGLVRNKWKQRCEAVHRPGTGGAAFHFERPDADRSDRYAEMLQDERVACLVVEGPATDFVAGNVGAWLSAGIPVVIWCRDDRASATFANHMRGVLQGGGIGSLPGHVLRLRRDAATQDVTANHVGRHITLIWDFVERLPPRKRLRPPGSTN